MQETAGWMAGIRSRLAKVPGRTWGVLALLVGLLIAGHVTGVTERLSAEQLRYAILAAGPCGVFWFLGAFSAGNIMNIPGVVFITASTLAYGPVAGAALALSGAVLASSSSFCFARKLRGRRGDAEGEEREGLKAAWAQRALGHLDQHPVLVIALLRCVMIVSPPLNYALAFSSVKHRDYVLGNLLGLILPIGVISVGADRALAMFA